MSPEDRSTDGPVEVLSALPTRLRWRVPSLIDQDLLARAVAADLGARRAVRRARANSVTGSVLVELNTPTSPGRAEGWLRQALARHRCSDSYALAAVVSAEVRAPPEPSVLRRLLELSDRHPEARRRAVLLSLANGLEDAVPPILVGLAADTASRGSASLLGRWGLGTATGRLLGLTGLSVGLWLAAGAVELHKNRAVARFARRVAHDLRIALYERLQQLDLAEVESKDVSDWMAILDHDVQEVDSFLRSALDPVAQTATNLLVVGVTLVIASPTAAAVQIVLLPVLGLASARLLGPIRRSHRAARDTEERWNQIVSGNVAGLATLSSFGAEASEARRVRDAARAWRDDRRRADDTEARYVPALRSIAGLGFVATLVSGTARVVAGAQGVGAAETAALAELRLLASLARIGGSLDRYQKAATALERIFATLDAQPTVASGPVTLARSEVRGTVVFDRVTFGYDPARPVLDGVSLEIGAGETVGLVGPSGAGKSTVLRLLLRFWDPQAGSITLDGVDLRRLDLPSLRGALALVAQRIVLFQGTIRENLVYGRRDARREEIETAARIAEAHGLIEELPAGYDTPIGFGGTTLSGGQRQRLAIARAVLADRPVLLFDEVTSSLDHATEAALQRSLADATRGRTTLVVAHRLSTVRHADRIYVLDEGRVREAGRHDELVAADGLYAAMWRVQTGERAGADDAEIVRQPKETGGQDRPHSAS